MISRQQIRQFLAVVETGSFTAAAHQIGVTQPSLSSAIRQLEAHLGARLFERNRPSVRLTAAANRLLPFARRIDREFKRAEIETAKSASSGQALQIGVIPTISTEVLARIAAEYAGPIAIREKATRTLLSELRKGTIDVALGLGGSGVPDGLHAHELWSEPYQLMVPADHPIARCGKVTAEETADEAMIARRSCEYLPETSKFFTDRGVRPRFSFKSFNDDKALALVRAGLGITVAPRSLYGDGIEAIELVDFGASRTIALIVREDDFVQARKYRETISALIGILGSGLNAAARR